MAPDEVGCAGPAVPETGVLTATDPEWDCACARVAVIAPLAALEVIGHAAADEAAAKLGLSRRQVYALVHRLRTGAGTVTDLLPGRSSGGRGARRLPETVDEVIADHLTRMYLKRQKPSVAVVYRAIVGTCVRQQLPVPARNTVAARIAALHPGDVARKREGTDSPAARSRRSAGGTAPSIDRIERAVASYEIPAVADARAIPRLRGPLDDLGASMPLLPTSPDHPCHRFTE